MTTAAIAAATEEPAIDPYELLEKLGNRDRIPRLLTTEDAGMSAVRPEALRPITGDFDGNGALDMAIAGVYNLPEGGKPYFLLVAGDASRQPRRLFQEDSERPYFLHYRGTTGNADPGDQAFSVTQCLNCETGVDFRWYRDANRFVRAAWKPGRTVVTTRAVESAPAAVPDDAVDKALRVAGAVPDVQDFVKELRAGGGKLGTRVEPTGKPGVVRVLIYEKTAGGENIYDAIRVDVTEGKVVGRRRK